MSDNITAIRPSWEIIHGDALKVLREFAPNTFDAVITDPPYASGGRTQAEKNKSTDKKYSSMGESAPPPFDGDSKDQRSWTRWAAEWLYDARKVCKPRCPCVHVYRLAAAPRSHRCAPVGGVDLARYSCLGQRQQPSPEGPLPPAG